MQVTQASAESTEGQQDRPERESRWLPFLRFALATIIAAAITDLLWRRVPNTLSASTDIVGYQTWADFDYRRYTDAYYCVAIIFPLLAIAACYVLGRWGPLRRPRICRAPIYRITTEPESPGDAEPTSPSPPAADGGSDSVEALPSAGQALSDDRDAPTSGQLPVVTGFWVLARVAVPALAIAVEVCLVRSPRQLELTWGGLLAGGAYVVIVLVAGFLLRWWQSGRTDESGMPALIAWRSSIALVNSLLALAVVPLLFFVSQKTGVYVSSEHRVVYYHWLPWWLVAIASLVCLGLWVRGLRRIRSTADSARLEATVLTWLVGAVIFFLLLAVLPGASGPFTGFDDAQFLAAPQLVFVHGLFPWRDIFLLHGILQDVFWGAVGLDVFGNTRWGGGAGISLLMSPLFWLVVYAFTAYFCRRNRLVLVGLVVAVTTGLLQGNTFRFLVIFGFLILFHRLLKNPSWGWCATFAGVLVVACIIVPEALLFALCLCVLLVIFEAVRYGKGDSIVGIFQRTIRCGAVGIVLLAAWALYLAVVGALSNFVDYYVIAALDHSLVGALPVQWNLVKTLTTTFEFAAPVVLWLMTVWRVVAKLRARSPWSLADWVMVGAASFVLVYYPQELERMDVAHVQLVFCVTLPLLILWAIELLAVADRSVVRLMRRVKAGQHSSSRSAVGGLVGRVPKRLVTGVVVAGVVIASVTMPISIPTLIRHIPGNFHPAVPDAAPTTLPKLGYTLPGAVDTAQINTLGRLLDRYAGRRGPVFDFPNELGVTYYLLNRVPGTRYFVASEAQTTLAQNQIVSDLQESRPRVVIFYDGSFGLPVYDGILESVRTPIVAEYLLSHYRPLVDMQGQLLMLRNDLVKTAPPLPPLPEGSQTTNLYFTIPKCTLGDIPNFYATPAGYTSSRSVRVRTTSVEDVRSAIGGWAIDPTTGAPATEVLAVADGKVVATAPTGVDRPDVVAALHDPSAETSGFTIRIPKAVDGPVALYALNPNGTVTLLQPDRQTVPLTVVGGKPRSSVLSPNGVVHPSVDTRAAGWVDSYQEVNQRIVRLDFPLGTNLATYPWLQLQSSSTLGRTSNVLTNDVDLGSTHQIGFNSLPLAGSNLSVQVGSCLQWHGYRSGTGLYLVRSGPGANRSVSVELRR
jgi:hypothetical protein